MPQCLSPQFESKSPAIVELLSSAIDKCKSGDRLFTDKLTEYDVPERLFSSKPDYQSGHVLSVNKSTVSGSECLLDDFVYLEFFVDTIKPEYASLNGTNVTFTTCVNNFKLTNGMMRHFYYRYVTSTR